MQTMTHRLRTPCLRQPKGFSLIELLVSITIGLVILVAAMSAYLGTASASRNTEAQARMNEDGQAALNILAQQIRMAGNNPDQPNRIELSRRNPVYGTTTFAPVGPFTTSDFIVRGCDGAFSNITATTAVNIDSLACTAGTSTLPDSIAISYEADRFNTVAAAGGRPTDCLGFGLNTVTASLPTVSPTTGIVSTTTVPYWVADNRFYIGTSTVITTPSLYCKGNGGSGAPQPLVENVENMQFLYGTVSTLITATTATVGGYLTADEVVTETSLAALASDAARWAKVVTVRICVVIRSENTIAPDAGSARYLDCTGTLVTSPPDLRLRRAYSTTVVLRNRIP